MSTAAIHQPATTATPDVPRLSIGGLAAEAAAVLWDAERWGLPRPCMVTVYDGSELSFQFADDKSSFSALVQWADAFGGTITSKQLRDEKPPARVCRVHFGYHGVRVKAYAIVSAVPATR